MKINKSFVCTCVLLALIASKVEQVNAFQRLPTPTEVSIAEQAVTESALRAHIEFLANDLLEGRGPGTRGDDLAMAYVQSQFKLLGLEPVGENGSWIQRVPLVGVTTKPPTEINFDSNNQTLTLRNRDDYIMVSGNPVNEQNIPDGDLVFVGYGIQAPEYQWDDFKDVDVKGKFLLMMNNDPSSDPKLFDGKTRLYYGRWDYKYSKAAELGAAGAIIIHTTPSAGYPFQVVQTSWSGEQMALDTGQIDRLPMEGWLTAEAAEAVVTAAGFNLQQLRAMAESRDFRPIDLKTKTSLQLKAMVRKATTGNVLGLLPGRDPKLKDQWLLFTAHHDHIGKVEKRDKNQDHIYNGAVDNASGVGSLLTIARAFSMLPPDQRPRRSILFAAVGAEEQGLLGSEYLAKFPPIPAGRMAAVINIDGINTLGRTSDLVAIGKGKSDLDSAVNRLARWQNRVVVADQFPDKGFYYRSDQFSFAKIGVPGVYLGSGTHVIGKPDDWGPAKMREWTETTYHQVSDEYRKDWDLAGAIEDNRLMFHLGLTIANQDRMPAWVPGDEFEAIRLMALESNSAN